MDEGQAIAGGLANGQQPLRAVRTNLFITAVLEWSGTSAPVTLRNLSNSGVLVEGALLPPAGARIELVRGSLSSSGSVAWVRERRCGLALDDEIVPALWMARPRNPRQAEIDLAVQRIKVGKIIAPPAPAPASDDLASALRVMEEQLAAVSQILSSAPETVARHAAQLRTLVLLAQELARLRLAAGACA